MKAKSNKDIDSLLEEESPRGEFMRGFRDVVKAMVQTEVRDKDGEPAGMSPPMDWPEDEEYDRRTGYKEPKGGSGTPA